MEGEDRPPVNSIANRVDGGGFYITDTFWIDFNDGTNNRNNTFKNLQGRSGGAIYYKSSLNSEQALRMILSEKDEKTAHASFN